MNTDTFFRQFDSLIELPGGVAKIRELILQLAVLGKLVPQMPDVEHLDAVFDSEPQSPMLPETWRTLNFEKHCDIQGGNQPPKSKFVSVPLPGYVRLFQIRDLGDKPVPTYIPRETTNRFCRPGEILIGRYGASVGKVFWAQDGAYNVALAKFIYPLSAFTRQFAFLVLTSNFFQEKLSGMSRSAQAGFNKGDLACINFPLPPLAEQQRIVAKVDQLMALCDELEARQERKREGRERLVESSLANLLAARNPTEFAEQWRFVRDNFDKLIGDRSTISALRQTILHLAVRGRIDAPEPNDTPVSRVLAELEIARKEMAPSGNARVSVGAEAVQPKIPLDLPPTWGCECLGSLAAVSGGVTLGRKLEGKAVVAKPYLRVANVQQGFLDLTITKTVLVPPSDVSKFRLQPGDVLLTEGGDWDKLGRSAVWNGEIADCLHQNHIFRARLLSRLLRPEWVSLFTNSPVGRRYFQDAAKQTTNLATINMAQLRSCPIPVPPPESQDRVLAKVTTLMGLCDDLQERLERVCTSANGLLDYAIDSMGG
jgi:type I restriction enzyme S subunit